MSSLLGIRAPIVPPPRPVLGSTQSTPGPPELPDPLPLCVFHSSPPFGSGAPPPPPQAGRETSESRPSAIHRTAASRLRFIEIPPRWEKSDRRFRTWAWRGGGKGRPAGAVTAA